MAKLKEYAQVDTANMAGIGYCFGGGMLLNFARMGEPLKGVVSFHEVCWVPRPTKTCSNQNCLYCMVTTTNL